MIFITSIKEFMGEDGVKISIQGDVSRAGITAYARFAMPIPRSVRKQASFEDPFF